MTPVLMAVCLAAGFGLGWLTKRHRLGLLAENNHWVGEEIEALKGADLDADVARERALRLSGEQPAVDDEWAMARMVGMTDLRTAPQPGNWLDPLPAGCGWSDGDTVCGDPTAGTVTWPEGPVDLCATHMAWARESEDAPVAPELRD